ncbi:MAG: hypothetical protein WD431_07060 [Cyclobacteriaceae bacterium]
MKSKLLFLPDIFFVFLIVFSCEPTNMDGLSDPNFNKAENKISPSKESDMENFLSLQFLKYRDLNMRFSSFTDRGVEKMKILKEYVSKE